MFECICVLLLSLLFLGEVADDSYIGKYSVIPEHIFIEQLFS